MLTLGGWVSVDKIRLASYLEDQSKEPWVLWYDDPTTSIRVQWESKAVLETELNWGLSASSLDNTLTDDPAKIHHIDIEGLTPNTTYYYKVSGFETVYHFKTAPTNPTSFRFVKVGDSQYGVKGVTDEYEGGGSPLVLEHMRANYETEDGPDFDFYLASGDQVDRGTPDHYKRYFQDWAWAMNEGVPWVAAPGNHETYLDEDLSMYYDYYDYSGSRAMAGHTENFWVSYGNMMIINIMVSSSGSLLKSNEPRNSILTWVEEILSTEASKYDWVIINQHHPIFMSAWYPGNLNPDGYDPILLEEELPLIEEYGVDLLISGHWHSYERLTQGNCTFMVSGGGGGSLDEWGNPQSPADGEFNAQSNAFGANKHSYTVFDVEGTQLSFQTWAVDGELIDSATLYSS